MAHEYSLQFQINVLVAHLGALENLLVSKGLITSEECEEEIKKIENGTMKEVFEKTEYQMKVEQIAAKGSITEEDEKYLRENNKWDSKEDIEECIEILKSSQRISNFFEDFF